MPRLLLWVTLACVVSSCVYNSDCTLGQTCEEQVCLNALREVYQPCSLRFTCSVGLQCLLGRCYHSPAIVNEPCLLDSQCAGGLSCDPSFLVCKERSYQSL